MRRERDRNNPEWPVVQRYIDDNFKKEVIVLKTAYCALGSNPYTARKKKNG